MTNQNDQAKSLLDQVRKKNGRYMMSPYGPFGPTIPIGGVFDEMIELYLAARKEDDQLKGQVALEQQQEKSRALSAKYQELQAAHNALKHQTNHDKGVRGTALNFLAHLLRTGDVVVTYNHVRLKILDRSYSDSNPPLEEPTLTYVHWDTRRKTWAKTSHTSTMGDFCHAYRIVTVERPEDKAVTKARKQKAKKG